jgi:hypothetical protein
VEDFTFRVFSRKKRSCFRYKGMWLLLLILSYGTTSGVAAQNISTVAGNGVAGNSGDGGLATAAKLNQPTGVTIDASGNLYIADFASNVIREVAAGTGIITTVAGTGVAGYSGDGGAATASKLNGPEVIVIDGSGNLYIADQNNHAIRMVTAATGKISTFAGTGVSGFSGDGGIATLAKLNGPEGVAVDGAGNVYIADQGNNRIREVIAAAGFIFTIAGTGIAGFSGDGAAATAAKLNAPASVDVDISGNVYIADYSNNRIRMITAASGFISTISGTGVQGYSGDGAVATAAKINNPYGVSVDQNFNILIADYSNNVVRLIDGTTANISTIAGNGIPGYSGDGGLATLAKLSGPLQAVYQLSASNVFIADWNNHVVREITSIVLPVELLYFRADTNSSHGVDLIWATASESNNDCFIIERSKTGSSFNHILQIKGAGNSSEQLTYKATDPSPFQGVSYYRLRQVDFNGQPTLFEPVLVNLEPKIRFSVFPSPSHGNDLCVSLGGDIANKEMLVSMYDMEGKLIYSKTINAGPNNELISPLNLTDNLPPGIYVVIASSENYLDKQRIVIQ